jgi:hypothetical protein
VKQTNQPPPGINRSTNLQPNSQPANRLLDCTLLPNCGGPDALSQCFTSCRSVPCTSPPCTRTAPHIPCTTCSASPSPRSCERESHIVARIDTACMGGDPGVLHTCTASEAACPREQGGLAAADAAAAAAAADDDAAAPAAELDCAMGSAAGAAEGCRGWPRTSASLLDRTYTAPAAQHGSAPVSGGVFPVGSCAACFNEVAACLPSVFNATAHNGWVHDTCTETTRSTQSGLPANGVGCTGAGD